MDALVVPSAVRYSRLKANSNLSAILNQWRLHCLLLVPNRNVFLDYCYSIFFH